MIEGGRRDGGFVLRYGGLAVPFRVDYRRRKTLAITVHPEMRLEVCAPEGAALEQVLEKVQQRAGWIARQWRYFEEYQPARPAPRYVSGETHLYLGRQYRLKVQAGVPEGVKLIGRFLHVTARDREDGERVQGLLEGWYRRHARRVFARRLECCREATRTLKLDVEPALVIRKMAKRWGSCSGSGTILLNLDLVKVPVHCIDYVLVHELCHLKVANHGREFYRLLARCMPDWEERKTRLEKVVL